MLAAQSISRFRKERFLAAMSEDDFRDKVVRPLLLRLGYKDGRDLCGPQEAGKDAIFTEQDTFGNTTVLAVQTKKGNLTLAAKVTNNLVEALVQVRTALATEVVFVSRRTACRPNKVFLCASGKINDAAKRHILEAVGDPNVSFLDADDLIPKIDDFFPELWLGIEVDLLPYFQAIRALVTGPERTTLLPEPDEADGLISGAASDELFVALNLHRSTFKIKRQKGKVIKEPHFEELPLTSITGKKHTRVLLVGEAGSGKTTGLLRLAYVIASQSLGGDAKDYKIPILLRATEIDRQQPSNFIEYCANACMALAKTSKPCFALADLEKGRVIVLIDSLDELPTDSARSRVLEIVESSLARYQLTKVIVTSRPIRFSTQLAGAGTYLEYWINPISWKQAERILKIVRKGDRLTHHQSQEMLRKLERLHGIELNPLLVTVFAATSDYAKQDIPANITELFKKFTELMLGRWDERKGLHQQYQATLKDFVLQRLGYKMHADRTTSIARAEAVAIMLAELQLRGHGGDAEALLSEILDRSGMFRMHEDQIEFRHLLLQEFFAGRGIRSANLSVHVADEWWKRALVFYFGEHPEQIEELRGLISSVNRTIAADSATAATTIGLALQACYLAPVAEKLDVWKWVVDVLCIAKDEWLRELDKTEARPLLGFIHFYLYGRDSVSLSNIKPNLRELESWANSAPDSLVPHDLDARRFWLISALIESGELRSAEALVRKFSPKDRRLLLGLHLGSFLTEKIRPVSALDKTAAQQICQLLHDDVDYMRRSLVKEYGSALLELKNGSILPVDSEET